MPSRCCSPDRRNARPGRARPAGSPLQPRNVGGERGQHFAQRLGGRVDRLAAGLPARIRCRAPQPRRRPCLRPSSAPSSVAGGEEAVGEREPEPRSRALRPAIARRANGSASAVRRNFKRIRACCSARSGAQAGSWPESGRAPKAPAAGRRARPRPRRRSAARKAQIARSAARLPSHGSARVRTALLDCLRPPAAAAPRLNSLACGTLPWRPERQGPSGRCRSLRSAPAAPNCTCPGSRRRRAWQEARAARAWSPSMDAGARLDIGQRELPVESPCCDAGTGASISAASAAAAEQSTCSGNSGRRRPPERPSRCSGSGP